MKKYNLLGLLMIFVVTLSCKIDKESLDSPEEIISDGGQEIIQNPNSLKSARVDSSNSRFFSNPSSASGSCYNFDATGTSINSWCSECHHAGKDYCGTTSDDIVSIGSGRIAYVSTASDGKSGSGDNRGFGKTVIVAHKMPDKTNMYSLYAHLSSISTDVTIGKYITNGYYSGKKGSSGGGANGITHLHFEMKNNPVLGHTPDCSGVGCVGYVKKSLLPVKSRGYCNPNDYIGQKEFYDLTLDSNLPIILNKNNINIPVKINSPFSENCNVDIRLSLYDVTGNYKGDIQAFNNLNIKSGSNTITFTKSSLTSPVGSYLLQLSYKVPNSATWLSFPIWSSYTNPSKITVK